MSESRYPSLYVDYLGRQLRLWSEYGISDTRALKLLRLWVGYGLTSLMDKKGRYTFADFNQLRAELGYRSIDLLLDDVRRSQSFVLVSCDIESNDLKDCLGMTHSRPAREYSDRLTAFFSPLWHKLEESDGEALPGSIGESRKKSCICNCICNGLNNNTLDNNIPPGGTAGAVAAEESAAGEASLGSEEEAEYIADVEAAEQEELLQRTAATKVYLQGLVHNPDAQQREPIDFLLRWLQQPDRPTKGRYKTGYGLTAEEAHQVIAVLIEHELAPHFARDRSFWSPAKVAKPENRIYQVTPYVKKYCQTKVRDAVARWRKQHDARQRAQERREEMAMRQNHPLSPYEWQDTEGRRWMEDERGYQVEIVAGAPPRPSETALWNYFEQTWI